MRCEEGAPSSGESTPQRVRWEDREGSSGRLEAPRTEGVVRRGAPVLRLGLGAPSPALRTGSLRLMGRKASSAESSACSSVLSSLESVESNTSEGGLSLSPLLPPSPLLHRLYPLIKDPLSHSRLPL